MNDRLFEILNEIIDKDFVLPNTGGKVVFNEYQVKPEKCQRVEIQTSKKVFAMKLDQGNNLFNCFNPRVENISKKNDGILIYRQKQKFVVLLIELKSLDDGGYLKQLKAGKNFIEYVIRQINLFYEVSITEADLIFRGVLFKLFRATPKKGITKRTKLMFKDAEGLMVARLECNQNYNLQIFREAIT